MTDELSELDALLSGRVVGDRYTLEELIGSGGMGVVFGGRDLRTGKSIAIKRLHTRHYDDAQMRTSMAHEVRALAQLRHPGIVGVLDFGLERGTPYVVMERVVGRTLASYIEQGLDWPTLRALGISILRTLAHAHARGVVHLDLKPQNIVVLEPTFVKIVDFGFAQLTDADDPSAPAPSLRSAGGGRGKRGRRRVRGTVGFMAPEQAAAEDARIGPASDLFAVGVQLYLSLSGRLPFPNFRIGAPLQELLETPARPLSLAPEVPADAAPIVRALLTLDSFKRGDIAADFARRLEALDPCGTPRLPELAPAPAPRAIPRDITDVFMAPTWSWALDPASDSHSTAGGSDASVSAAMLSFVVRPPAAEPTGRVLTARNELFGIREPLLSGRAAEQGWLLEPAAEVLQSRRARVRILRGAPGSGKTRLARWILQRSREDGSFRGLPAFYGRGGANSGVRGALRDWLRIRSATQRQIAERVVERVGCSPYEAWAISAALTPGAKVPERRAEQDVVLALRHLARERPLLLWIDDAGASADGAAYRLVDAILDADSSEAIPIYVVATEGPSSSDDVAAVARRLERHPATRVHELPPLDDAAVRALARDLLPIDETTLDAAVGRAAGNPLFVTHLLAHWVEAGRLRTSGDVLSGPSAEEIPASLADVMSARIDGIARLAGDAATGEIPERVALLGRRVHRSLLARALDLEGREELGALVEPALDWWLGAGILREDEPGVLEIEQRELATLLTARARSRSSWSAAQRACAAAKAELIQRGEADATLLREVTEHLILSGRTEAAAEAALDAASRARRRGHAEAAEQCLALARDCMAELGSPSARLQARLEIAVAETELHAGRVGAARIAAGSAVAAARAAGDPKTLAAALATEGDLVRHAGAMDDAIERLLEASEIARSHELSETLGHTSYALGWIHYARGDLARSHELAAAAASSARAAGDAYGVLMAGSLARSIALARGDLDAAVAGIDADRTAAEALDFPMVLAQLDRHLGEVAVVRGEAERAREHFARQLAVLELLGDPHLSARGHLGKSLGFLEMGRSADADAAAARAEVIAEELGTVPLRRDAAVMRAHAAALQDEWARVGAHLALVTGVAEDHDSMEPLVARTLSHVGRLCIDGGRPDLAQIALSHALVHLRRLGSPEVPRLEALLGGSSAQ